MEGGGRGTLKFFSSVLLGMVTWISYFCLVYIFVFFKSVVLFSLDKAEI